MGVSIEQQSGGNDIGHSSGYDFLFGSMLGFWTMKISTKPTLIITGTLILGMVLGALLFSVFMHYRMEKLRTLMSRHGFRHDLLEALGPLHDPQQSAVEHEINQSSIRIDSTINQSRKQIDALVDSMIMRLDTILTADQKARLHREIGFRFRKHDGPHQFGFPPNRPPSRGMPHDGPPPDGPPPDGRPDRPQPDDSPPDRR
jgi:hypothetical protein